jgi:hypothetical protein
MNRNSSRVLVSTVGAWSNSVGSNTMSEFFKYYDKDKLANLYIRANISDSSSCKRYFHIFEGRVLKSILKRNTQTGEEYTTDRLTNENTDLDEEKARYDKFRKKKNWLYMFARELVWKFGKWKTKELDAFLDNFDPDVLVCPIESYIHFNRINEYIVKKKHPRVIGFLWDDNFTYKQNPASYGYRMHRWWLRKGVKRMVKLCETIVVLSPKMKMEADKEFGINSVILTKPIFNQPVFNEYMPSRPLRLLYTGNLHVNRDQTIATLVDIIREINKFGHKILLDVYTSTPVKPALESRIKVDGCCIVHKPVKQSEVLQLQKETDVLLFVEALESETGGYARLSFSTKLTDYFCAGKCIWAIGNDQMSAIDYLKSQDAALCSLDRESIKETLIRLVSDNSLVNEYASKGWACGHENHNSAKILNTFYTLIDKQ